MSTSNRAPAVNATNATVLRNQSVAASLLFSTSDADNDTITQYEFWDGGAAANGGHFAVNGITQGANQTIALSSASLAQTRYFGGDEPGSETVWVRAYDGADWSAWKSWTMTTQGSALVVSAADRSVHINQSLAASTLFSVSDADGDAITRYEFWDSGASPTSGHFALANTPQPYNQTISVTAANLGQLTYVGGNGAGSETLWVRADDGTGFGAWVSWTMSTGNNAPVVSAANATLFKGQSVAASTLFDISDADADTISQYEFWDSGTAPGSGHFSVNGVTQLPSQSILVSPANIASVNYVGASAGSAETVWVRANDGIDWGAWKSWTMTTQNRAPAIVAANTTVTRNRSVAASSLFSVSDADGDTINRYEFWDGNGADSGGHFTVNGIVQGANRTVAVPAAGLAQTRYVAGDAPGAETVWVRAYDGSDWSTWQSWNMSTQGNAPVASVSNRAMHIGQSVAASTLISVSDADSDATARYEFWDSGAGATSGHFAVGGAAQGANQAIPIGAANLGQLSYVSGSAVGVETLWVRADDGTGFGAWVSWTMSTGNAAPVVSTANGSLLKGQSVAASSVFSVSDSEADAITQYEFWDSGAGITSGHFTVGGITRAANTSIPVLAANLGQVSYVGGSAGGGETVWVRANDGTDWGEWKSLSMDTRDQLPVVTTIDGAQHWGQSVFVPDFFSVSDADGDAITKYEFWDGGGASSSGYFAIDGQHQSANTAIPVTAAHLSHVTYVAGTSAGPETVWVRANDGDAWSDWKSWTMTTRGNKPLLTPTSSISVIGSDLTVAASTLFSAANSDSLTEYQFWDGSGDATSGHFILNGAAQPANQAITVSAADLAQLSYVGGSKPGVETVWVRASDGSGFGEWVSWAMDTRLRFNEVIGTSGVDQFFETLSDSAYFGRDGADYFQVRWGEDPFWLGGPGGDYYWVGDRNNNVLVLESGNSPDDSIATGAFGFRPNSVAATIDNRHLLLMNTELNTAAIIIDWQKPENRIENWSLPGAPILFTYDQMLQVLANLRPLPLNLTWEQLGYSTTDFNEAISYYTQREEKIINNHAPVVTGATARVRAGSSIPLTSLFQARDPDGDLIQRYEFDMGVDSPRAGYITIAGVAHQEQVVLVEAADLAGARYVATSDITRTERIQIRAYDGLDWGAQSQAIAAVELNHAPIMANSSGTTVYMQGGTAELVSTWFRVFDPEGDPVTQYQFMNSLSSDLGSPTGRFVLNGVTQSSNQWFGVDASQLDSLLYFAGNPSQPFEEIQAKVSDGQLWSDARVLHMHFPQPLDRPPVLTLKNDVVAVLPGQSIAVASWFEATDPDGSGITQFRFTDGSAAGNSGFFTVNNIVQAQNSTFTVTAAQLADTRFVGGQPDSSGSVYDRVSITAFEGASGSASPSLTVITTSNRPPVVIPSLSSVALNYSVPASALFFAHDPDNDQITRYSFTDFGDDPTSGYLTFDGLRLTSGTIVKIDAADLGLVRYVGGSAPGTEMISVGASTFLTPDFEPAGFARFSIQSGSRAIDGAGNDMAHAQPVTVGASPSVFSDFVGNADSADYYQLNVGTPGDVVLGLTQLAGNADLQLLDSSGDVLASSLNLGPIGESSTLNATSESISQNLAAGTYYAHITPTGGDDTSYKFTALLAQP